MKKTIAIHINKTVFQIDEDAYQELEKYLNNIKKYYGQEDEGKEILNDIEAGIAEKFEEIIKDKNQSLTINDVIEITKIMGTVEEIEDQEKTVNTPSLKSDNNDNTSLNNTTRRLYRNPDDVIIAGVCSGLAAYFNIDPVYVRLAFVIAFFLNGIGFIAYIILWLVMPLAKTSYQKLEMQGEPINIKKIEETVKEKTKIIRQEGQEALKKINKDNPAIKKIMTLPFKIIGNIFYVIKKFFLVIIPIMAILLGTSLIIGATFAFIGITTILFAIFFNTGSVYIHTDIPLEIFVNSHLYYPGILSIYFLIFIPIIMLFILGITLMRRKNSFNIIFTIILISIWAISFAGTLSFAAEIAPQLKTEVNNLDTKNKISRDYEYTDWKKIYLGGNIKLTIKKGDEYKIKFTGQEKDLDLLNFNIEDGQLQITEQNSNEQNKICIFCHENEIEAEIITPNLESLVLFRNVKAIISDFEQDLYVSLGESAEAETKLQGQNVKCNLAGTNSHLKISGIANEVDCEMNGHSKLTIEKIKAKKITLYQDFFSYSKISGESEELYANLYNGSNLEARRLETKNILVKTYDFSSASLEKSTNIFDITEEDQSNIEY